MPDENEARPLDKREIKGLTFESLIKYGSIIVSIISATYLVKAKTDENSKNIELNRIEIEKLAKRLDVQETKQNADEVWKARIEEQIKPRK